MKRFAFVVLAVLLMQPRAAEASEKYVCTVTATSPATGNTASATAGTCNWNDGTSVVMQCSAKVHYTAIKGATANTDAMAVDFGSNPDGYRVLLAGGEKHISFLPASGSVTCRFYGQTR